MTKRSFVVLSILLMLFVGQSIPTVRAAEVILCENQVFEGNYSKLIIDDAGPALKIVRNCTWRNSTEIAIVVRNASNVLIENSHFENIRSGVPGLGAAFGVYFGCQGSVCPIRNVTIRGNTFVDIGADGLQLGDQSRDIQNVIIENNLFYVTNDDVGENGVDLKSGGPYIVRNNVFHGFRPCDGATQDCTGSNGVGMVVHAGSAAGQAPHDVIIEGNEFYDNIIGLRLSDGSNFIVRNNNFHDNQKQGVSVSSVSNCTQSGNVFINNGDPPEWGSCVAGGGPTATIQPTLTRTPTVAPTNTPIITATSTPTATKTNTPVATVIASQTIVPSTVTFTPVPSSTFTPGPTPQTVVLNLGDRVIVQANGCRLRIVNQNNNTVEIRCRP